MRLVIHVDGWEALLALIGAMVLGAVLALLARR
jgi:hypothetical protein